MGLSWGYVMVCGPGRRPHGAARRMAAHQFTEPRECAASLTWCLLSPTRSPCISTAGNFTLNQARQ